MLLKNSESLCERFLWNIFKASDLRPIKVANIYLQTQKRKGQ